METLKDATIYPNWTTRSNWSTRWRTSLDDVKDRFEAMLPDLLKGIGITGKYTFPDGIMCPPDFINSKDKFVYELAGGDVWYRELVAEHTGMRIFIMKTRYGKAELMCQLNQLKY